MSTRLAPLPDRAAERAPSCTVQAHASTSERLAYDTPAYAAALEYLGQPLVIPSLPCGLVERTIPGSVSTDVLAAWPYVTPWSAEGAGRALPVLRARGNVTVTAVFRPDAAPDVAGLARVGVACRALKEHFVFDRGGELPAHGPRTRENLSRARRHWRVEPVDLATSWRRLFELHQCVVDRRPRMSAIARPSIEHFSGLSRIAEMTALGADDGAGLAGAFVLAVGDAEVHGHLLFGDERYYRRGAAYALFSAVIERWGRSHTIYLGGAPAGADGDGIARFKRRFATRTTPVTLATAVLDHDTCARLTTASGGDGAFPPYRH